MYHRLRMHQHLYFLHRYIKQPTCLYHLKALVHHAGRVNRNLRAHFPIGVLKRLSGCHTLHLFVSHGAKRSTAGSKQQFLNAITRLTHQTLEDGRVLTIYWQNRHLIMLRQSTDNFTRYDQSLFISQSDCFLCTYGFHRWTQTRIAHHGCHHHIYIRHSYHLSNSIHASHHLYR